jgi:hypothetical protein
MNKRVDLRGSLTSYMALGKFFNLSQVRFPYLEIDNNYIISWSCGEIDGEINLYHYNMVAA